jgi:hypothetical protein
MKGKGMKIKDVLLVPVCADCGEGCGQNLLSLRSEE